MNRKKAILRNSMIGLISQVVATAFTFVSRSLFIKYIGVEILGINSTFTSVLNTLALSELGFQTAVAYSLYKPIHDNNQKEINDIVNIFRIVYRYIGLFFIVASFVLLPFLKYIITGTPVTNRIYVYFLLQAAASTCTYFLAYKRTVVYADQKEYVSKTIDMTANIIFNILQCVVIVLFRNYIVYLFLKILQVYCSNAIVHFYCKKTYPYLYKDKINFVKFKEIWTNVKNVFAGRIASYVYTSTDSLVISIFVSTTSVGYFANYMTIVNSLKTLTGSVLMPITPTIGHFLVEENDSDKKEESFLLFTHVRYLIALLVGVPTIVLIDEFIRIWIGEGFILSRMIVTLISADFYIHLVHSASAEYINSGGLFKTGKYIEIAGAVVNIVTSVLFVNILGIEGVLIGTVISQMILWIGRSAIVYFQCLNQTAREYFLYWLRNAVYLVIYVIAVILCCAAYSKIQVDSLIFKFLFGGIVCEIIIFIYAVILFCKLKEQKKLLRIVGEIIHRRYK